MPIHVGLWFVWLSASLRYEDPWLALYALAGVAQTWLSVRALRASLALRREDPAATGVLPLVLLAGLALVLAVAGTLFGGFLGIVGKALGGA